MARIGIYVYTQKIRERSHEDRAYFDNVKYLGLRRIISELKASGKHELSYVSNATVNDCDYVLLPIVSFRDIFNVVHELKNVNIKSRVIAGGPGLQNPFTIRPYIWAAVIGRAENQIERILDKEELPNVWYCGQDLARKLEVGQLSSWVSFDGSKRGEMPKHLRQYEETHIGCQKKCYFCHYTWKHRFLTKERLGSAYRSGLNDCETTIADINWVRGAAPFVTAIDGLTERSRVLANRGNITNAKIEATLKAHFRDGTPDDGKLQNLKVYCIVAYPWEREEDISLRELGSIIKRVDRSIKKRRTRFLNVVLYCTHFVPMPLTPLEPEGVNWINARNILRSILGGQYEGRHLRLRTKIQYCTSPTTALEQTFLNRFREEDRGMLHLLVSKRYLALKGWQKEMVFKELVPDYYYEQLNYFPSLEFLEAPYDINKARRAYKARLGALESTRG